jgi:4-hydroxy-2-oxoglutarate aldolase
MTIEQTSLDLHGIFPPIPTPFNEAGDLALDQLGENLDRWAEEPINGYVVGGSNGEFVSLRPDERLAVVRFVSERVGGARLIIAGSGLQGTHETIRQTEAMASLGARAALVVTPSYYKGRMDDQALFAHYQQVAKGSPIPIVLYNVPANTGINMNANLIIRLSEQENIIGLKDSSGDVVKFTEICARARPGFQLLAGSASFMLPALTVGAVGAIAALANIASEALDGLNQAFQSGNLDEARLIQQRLVPANTAVTAMYGVAGLKYALDLKGYFGGLPRSPLQPLGSEEQLHLQTILEDAGLLPAQ